MATFTITTRGDIIRSIGSTLVQAGAEKGDGRTISVTFDDSAGNGVYQTTDSSGKVKKH